MTPWLAKWKSEEDSGRSSTFIKPVINSIDFFSRTIGVVVILSKFSDELSLAIITDSPSVIGKL